ncbi:MAG: DNA-processing protein DprA [Patescibacteria group bacterium]
MTENRLYTILWLSVNGIARKTFYKIKVFANRHDLSLKELWLFSGKYSTNLGLNKRQQIELEKFKKIYTTESFIDKIQSESIKIVLDRDEIYPKLLSVLDDRPIILFCKGNLELLKQEKTFAVVGTRKITPYGKQVTRILTEQLVKEGFLINSGFMYGVDTQAHLQAMRLGGRSIGVLGFGFDNFYPVSNKRFSQKFLETGNLLITEFAPQIVAQAGNFPLRNRIVAGMSLGVLVAEAALKSGSHITALHALEYGRFVGAIPGPISNPYSEGTKYLVNQGAKLVSCVEDILEDLEYLNTRDKKLDSDIRFADKLEKKIYKILQANSLSIDELSKELKISIPELTAALTMMELNNQLKREGDSWQIL